MDTSSTILINNLGLLRRSKLWGGSPPSSIKILSTLGWGISCNIWVTWPPSVLCGDYYLRFQMTVQQTLNWAKAPMIGKKSWGWVWRAAAKIIGHKSLPCTIDIDEVLSLAHQCPEKTWLPHTSERLDTTQGRSLILSSESGIIELSQENISEYFGWPPNTRQLGNREGKQRNQSLERNPQSNEPQTTTIWKSQEPLAREARDGELLGYQYLLSRCKTQDWMILG